MKLTFYNTNAYGIVFAEFNGKITCIEQTDDFPAYPTEQDAENFLKSIDPYNVDEWEEISIDEFEEFKNMRELEELASIKIIIPGWEKIKVNTYGFGWLDLLTENEEYKYTKGYNDAEIDGVTYAVGESEKTGKLVEVREREDKTLFAVLIDT